MKKTYLSGLALLAAAATLPASSLAEGDASAGKIKAFTCMGCHGVAGYNNAYPTYHVPKLGGQHAAYLVAALQAEGCEVTAPRYPLVHEQPFFSEGHWQRILRAKTRQADLAYDPATLNKTRAYSHTLLRLPTFPSGGRDILDQYLSAVGKVLAQGDAILAGTSQSHG